MTPARKEPTADVAPPTTLPAHGEDHPDAVLIALEAEWRKAEDFACADGITDDERDRRVDVSDAIATRIAEAPARTLEGIAIKLRWVRQDAPVMPRQVACVRTALEALAWQRVPMGGPVLEGHLDAALLALEKEWIAAYASTSDPEIDKDEEEFDRRFRMADAIALRMSEMSACTVAGVMVKLRWVHHFQCKYQQFVSPIEQSQEVCVRGALADLARIGGQA